MERITFENTTVTKQPYVIIDGNEYEVQEGTYQGGTDLDADTFNTLQDNIEDALSNVGGNEIAISETEPTTETTKLWINSGEISQQASEITNSYSTSTGIGYSANYVNHINTYSNVETQIGYWYDKPLYRKILTLPTLANNGEVNVAYDSTYLIKRYEIYCENPAVAKISLNIPTNNYISSYIDYTNHRVAVQTSSDRTAFTNNYVIIEYTKTTD